MPEPEWATLLVVKATPTCNSEADVAAALQSIGPVRRVDAWTASKFVARLASASAVVSAQAALTMIECEEMGQDEYEAFRAELQARRLQRRKTAPSYECSACGRLLQEGKFTKKW